MATKKKGRIVSGPVLSDIAIPTPQERGSVRFRKIDNGYIVTEEGVRAGKYFERERFTPKKPNLSAAIPKT